MTLVCSPAAQRVWETLCQALEVFHGDTWCGGCDVFFFWRLMSKATPHPSVPGVNLQSKHTCRGAMFYLSIKSEVRDMQAVATPAATSHAASVHTQQRGRVFISQVCS